MYSRYFTFFFLIFLWGEQIHTAASSNTTIFTLGDIKKITKLDPKNKNQVRTFLLTLRNALETQEKMLDNLRLSAELGDKLEELRIDYNKNMYEFNMLKNTKLRIGDRGYLKGALASSSPNVFALYYRYPILNQLYSSRHHPSFAEAHYDEVKAILDQQRKSSYINVDKELENILNITQSLNEIARLEFERMKFGLPPLLSNEKILKELQINPLFKPLFTSPNGPLNIAFKISNVIKKFQETILLASKDESSILFQKTPEDIYFHEEMLKISNEYENIRPNIEKLKESITRELGLNKPGSESFIAHLPGVKKTPQLKAPASKRKQRKGPTTPIITSSSYSLTEIPAFTPTELPLLQDSSESSAASSMSADVSLTLPDAAQGSSSSSSSSSEQSSFEAPSKENIVREDDTLVSFTTDDGKTITIFKVNEPQYEIPAPTYANYSQTIKRWLANPEEELNRQIKDPYISPVKRAKLLENPEYTIFMHAFPTTVEKFFNVAGTAQTIIDQRTGEPIKVVTMYGSIEEKPNKNRFLAFRWLINKDNTLFHREATEVNANDLFNIITTSEYAAPRYHDIPELYQAEFPTLGTAKR